MSVCKIRKIYSVVFSAVLVFCASFFVAQEPVAAENVTISNLVAGGGHTCSVSSIGKVECWGSNSRGQLGHGNTADSYTPMPVPGLSGAITDIDAGFLNTCVLVENKTVKCWGDNNGGQLGHSIGNQSVPVVIPGISNVQKIQTGGQFICALLDDETVRCWGWNGMGQLGDGTNFDVVPPRMGSTGIGGVADLSAGHVHVCALLSDQSVKCWGSNSDGQLGNGSKISSNLPVSVAGLTGVKKIQAGMDFTCALLTDNTLKCWGSNSRGQLGNGTQESSYIPVSVVGISNALDIDVGSRHACALLSDKSVKCWGSNSQGQLGNGTQESSSVPVTVSGLADVNQVAGGGAHTCALLSNQAIKCWGANYYGQLGDWSKVSKTSPVSISRAIGISDAVAGQNHTCALLSDQTVKCWGSNSDGQLGDGSNISNKFPVSVKNLTQVVAVSAGGTRACALLSDQTVKCWGKFSKTTPQSIESIAKVGIESVAIGTNQTCILRLDKTVTCLNGVLPTTFDLSAVSEITVGGSHGCALAIPTNLKCWGSNTSGQLGDGSTTNKVSPTQVLRIITPTSLKITSLKILGNGSVGKTLQADLTLDGGFGLVEYQWLANSSVLRNETKSTLKISSAHKGKKVTCRITVRYPGLNSITKVSGPIPIK